MFYNILTFFKFRMNERVLLEDVHAQWNLRLPYVSKCRCIGVCSYVHTYTAMCSQRRFVTVPLCCVQCLCVVYSAFVLCTVPLFSPGCEGSTAAAQWLVQRHGPGPGHLPPCQGRVPLGRQELLRCGAASHTSVLRQCLARYGNANGMMLYAMLSIIDFSF